LCPSTNIISSLKSRQITREDHVVHMGENINAYTVLTGNPEGQKLLGRSG
jgi:hypothetical protein